MKPQRIIGQRGIPGGIVSGTAYIYIPSDITNREQFISDCFNTATVSILTNDGQRFDNVSVDKNSFQYLDFPATVNDLGSMIFWVKISKHNLPVAVALLTKKGEVLGFQNGQFKIEKLSGNNIVSILGDGKKGNLFINVQSDTEGNVIINARNKDKNNKVKLNVDGDINTMSNNWNGQVLEQFLINIKNGLDDKKTQTVIKYTRNTGFSYKDQYNNDIEITKDGFSYQDDNKNKITVTKDGLVYQNDKGTFEVDKNGKFSFKNNSYSIKKMFEDFIDEVSNITTSTMIGIQPIINKAQVIALKNKLNNICK